MENPQEQRPMTARFQIDASATVHGKIRLGADAHITQGCVVRSEADSVHIGAKSWLLENSVAIGTREHSVTVGAKTVFGHKCLVVGASIGNLCEIGNGTIFQPGAQLGDGCITGEGTLIPAGLEIPDRSVVVGRPGRILRQLTEEDEQMVRRMRDGDLSLPASDEYKWEGKEDQTMKNLYEYRGLWPTVADSAVIYESAEITGDVHIGENTVIASGVRIIGNAHGPVRIGKNVQILENCVLHLLPDNELIIEDHVTIGPGCIIHGTHIGAHTVVEGGATVCDYSSVGDNCLIRAGSLVKQRDVVAANQIAEGFPAKSVGHNDGLQKRPDWAIRA